MNKDLTWKLKEQPTAADINEMVRNKIITADEGRDLIFNKGKRKDASKVTTVVHLLLDASGSMNSVRKETIDSYNEYVNSLKKDGGKFKLSLTAFDSDHSGLRLNKIHQDTHIDDVPELTEDTYVPDGMTPLHDAFVTTLKAVKDRDDEKHLFVVLTDGGENASREYTAEDMKKIKAEYEKKGNWTFVYLGANQDAFATGGSYGFSASNTSNFNATGVGIKTMAVNLAMATRSYSAAPSMSTSAYFSPDQQKENEETK